MLRAELNKDDEIGGVYGTLALDEARAMGAMTADQWCVLSREARAHKMALTIGERRISYYHSLQAEAESKRRQRS